MRPRVLLAVVVLLSIAAPAEAVHPSKKYSSDPRSLGIAFEDVEFPSSRDSVPLHGWWFGARDSAGVLVVCPTGNGNMADRLAAVREWVRLGYSVLAFDLRDFGPAGQGPADSLERLVFASRWVNDTEGALNFARIRARGRPVIAWGQDLGAALAVSAAGRRRGNVDALAIEGVFRSSQEQLLWLGLSQDPEAVRDHRRLVAGGDEPVSAAGRLRASVFAVLAGKDDVTPPNVTRQVVMRIIGLREFWTLPEAGHEQLELTPGYFDRISRWLRTTLARTAASRRPR